MNVLSLFDGMSCGQLALKKAGIIYNNYYSSEIDEYSMKIAQINFPETIQLGNVTELNAKKLPKIDLLIGGSPCQGFSMAGKQLNFEDERSKLFFEFVRLLNELKPKYFLLENVKMKKEYRDIISSYLGVECIEIDSSLLSAQNRKRLYWTNIENIKQPKDKKVFLSKVLERGVTQEKYLIKEESAIKQNIIKYRDERLAKQAVFTERRTEEAKKIRKEYRAKYGRDFSPRRAKEMVPRTDDKCNCLTTSLTKEHVLIDENYNFRKLTPTECERLQTVPDNYTKHINISDTQRYKMLGNGWTISVIAHIFKNIKNK
jgi:DNA-cytosine methyltransferase